MAKSTTQYQCQACQQISSRWQGRCFSCGAWDSLVEQAVQHKQSHSSSSHKRGYTGHEATIIQSLSDIQTTVVSRQRTGIDELDRVLGGGIVPGSVILLGGDPGAETRFRFRMLDRAPVLTNAPKRERTRRSARFTAPVTLFRSKNMPFA